MKLKFPANYPFKCPTVQFPAETLWHPQVEHKTGQVCALDLEKMWGPTKTVSDVAKFILNFMANPSADAVTEAAAAEQLRTSVKDFEKAAAASAAKLG